MLLWFPSMPLACAQMEAFAACKLPLMNDGCRIPNKMTSCMNAKQTLDSITVPAALIPWAALG
jgi:hypothetical protein